MVEHKNPIQTEVPVEITSRPSPDYRELAGATWRIVAQEKAIEAERRAMSQEHRQMDEKARIDRLTGLRNDVALEQELPTILSRAQKTGTPLALLFGDLDGLKRLNDHPIAKGGGHARGDDFLVVSTSRLGKLLRPTDILYRHGSKKADEIVGVLTQFTLPEEGDPDQVAHDRADFLQHEVNQAVDTQGFPGELHLGISLAIVVMQPDDTAESILSRAEEAMYENKRARMQALREKGITFGDSRLLSEPSAGGLEDPPTI